MLMVFISDNFRFGNFANTYVVRSIKNAYISFGSIQNSSLISKEGRLTLISLFFLNRWAEVILAIFQIVGFNIGPAAD